VAIPSLRQLDVEEARYESLLQKMAADALASGSPANNPREPTAAEIVGLYRRAYQEG
jgi:alcohol dehydrogenase class IV